MTAYGVDYSFSRPTPSQLKAAGKTFAVRYFGTTWSGKNATKAEVEALQSAGIDVVTNYEGGKAGWMSGGYNTGVAAAKAALKDAEACGMPEGRPIIFSADYNATYDQYKAEIKPAMRGACDVLGRYRAWIYGGLFQVAWAFEDGYAGGVWQTYAWSYGQLSRYASLYQYHNGVTLGSGIVDYDRSVNNATDFGQWGAQEQDMTKQEHDALMALAGSRGVDLTDLITKIETVYNQINIKAGTLHNDIDALAGKLDPEVFAAAVVAKLPAGSDAAAVSAAVLSALKELTLKVA